MWLLGSPVPLRSPAPAGDDGRLDDEPDRWWVARTWIVVAAFAAVVLWRSHVVGIPVRDPGGEIFLVRVLITLGLLVAFVVLDGVWRSRRAGDRRSVPAVVLRIRRRWSRQRVALAGAGLLAYHLVYFGYHNLKSWDVLNRPRDTMLAAADHHLFLGHSPAVLLHDLLGQGVAAHVLVVIYESFPTFVSMSFVAAVVFADRIRVGYVFLASAMWVWILGVASYYAIPSLGPFHSDPQDFAGLPTTIVTRTQALYLEQRDQLLAHPQASDSFAQVSAFASLHVGVTVVIVLMLRHYGLRRAYLVSLGYLAATLVATVYLGWHFALDDVAGLALGWAAVALGIRTVGTIVPVDTAEPEGPPGSSRSAARAR